MSRLERVEQWAGPGFVFPKPPQAPAACVSHLWGSGNVEREERGTVGSGAG